MSSPNILWYDLETWNNRPESARIVQFAAQRTDLNFKPIDAPMVYYVRPTRDFIASPYAILVHRLLPSILEDLDEFEGVPVITELQVLKKIVHQIKKPQTIVAGYNNLRFDNMVLRFSFYRNALEPYLLDFGNDNRWDLIDVLRCAHALRPKGMNWPINEQQVTSFKLEDLAKANQLTQIKAHDALSDVQATVELATKIKQAQPKLFDYLFEQRSSDKVMQLLGLRQQSSFLQGDNKPPMLVHISGMISAERKRAEVIVPVALSEGQANRVIAVDISMDPNEWLAWDVERLQKQVFASTAELQQANLERIRIFTVCTKFCPALAPISVLDNALWDEISLGKEVCLTNYQTLLDNLAQVTKKLHDLFGCEFSTETKDIDLSLYGGGFYSREDKQYLQQFQQADWQETDWSEWDFEHPSLTEICFRTQARNATQTLNPQDKTRWLNHCLKSWQHGHNTLYSYTQCLQDIEQLLEQEISADATELLIQYGNWLEDQYAHLQQQVINA